MTMSGIIVIHTNYEWCKLGATSARGTAQERGVWIHSHVLVSTYAYSFLVYATTCSMNNLSDIHCLWYQECIRKSMQLHTVVWRLHFDWVMSHLVVTYTWPGTTVVQITIVVGNKLYSYLYSYTLAAIVQVELRHTWCHGCSYYRYYVCACILMHTFKSTLSHKQACHDCHVSYQTWPKWKYPNFKLASTMGYQYRECISGLHCEHTRHFLLNWGKICPTTAKQPCHP